MASNPPQQTPDSGGIHVGDVGGSVNFSALGDIVSGDKITTITTTIQISVEAITQRPLITASPYRGLDRFEDKDKDLFFGRDQLIKSLLAQLSASNVLLVLGASGSGKSSVVRAGLLPQLAQLIGARFRYFTFVPDVNPFESLRSALQGAGFSQTQTRELAEAQAETPARLIRSLQRNGDQWLLFVDQFEEMFTVGDEKLRASFIAALVAIAQDPNSSTKLVLAMRADFLDRFSPFPQFAKIIEKNIDFVADMHADELRQAIEQPAARHGVIFEQGLVEEIIKDVQGQAGSLPLLQYTLDLLWQEEVREDGLADRHLNTRAYRELGGVRGALQKRADEIYASFGDGSDAKAATPKQEIVRQIFLRLVDLAGEGSNDAAWRPVRRRASMTMFTAAQEQEILQALINQKLLVSNREGDDATVEVAHEALFTSWGRLKNWIEAGKQVIFARNRLADDARRWQRRQQDDPTGAEEELLGGTRLGQALDMRVRGDFSAVVGGLGEMETQFLDASLALRDRRAQEEQVRQKRELEAAQGLAEARTLAAGRLRKGFAIAIVLALFAIAGGILALRQSRKASEQERKAKAETSRSEYLRALSLLQEGDADQALRSLSRSLELNPKDSEVATRLINLLGQRRWPHLVAIQSHPLPIGSLKKNGDATRIIAASRSPVGGFGKAPEFIYLHDAGTLKPVASSEVGSGITDLHVSGDRVLAAGTYEHTVILLDAKTGVKVKTWKGLQDRYGYSCTLSNDGRWAAVWWGRGMEVMEVVSAIDGKPRPQLPHMPLNGEPTSVMLNDAKILILDSGGNVTTHSLTKPEAAPIQTPSVVLNSDQVYCAQFTFGGNAILGVRPNGIEFWRLSEAGVNDGVSDLKGLAMFASASYLGACEVSDVSHSADGTDRVTIFGHNPDSTSNIVRSFVTQIARRMVRGYPNYDVEADWHSSFAPVCVLSSGIAVTQDTKAFVLPFHGGSFSGPLRHDSQITAICEIKDGVVTTGSADGVLKLWNVTSPLFLPTRQSERIVKRESSEGTLLALSRSSAVEVWGTSSNSLVIKREGKEFKVEALKVEEYEEPTPISSAELSPDGELGIFSVFRTSVAGGETSGAWIFNTRDGKLLSDSVGNCEWAGFTPNKKQVLTISHGGLRFWNLKRIEQGRMTFEATGHMLPQADMKIAVTAESGSPVITRSTTGDVIVWDGFEGKPLQWLKRDPLWNDMDMESEKRSGEKVICKPALSADARRLASAYGRAFAIWDVESGKLLSDPIYCPEEISELDFPPGQATKVEATLRNGSKVSWDYDAGGKLSETDAAILRRLAQAVADDTWIDDAPKLASDAHPSSPILAKLVNHFASQTRTIQASPTKTAPSPSATK
jgi:WD40 repeat protein